MAILGSAAPDDTKNPRLIPGRIYEIVLQDGVLPSDSSGFSYNWIFQVYLGEWWGFESRDGSMRIAINPAQVRYLAVWDNDTGELDNFGNWG